jgi:hypothetical protein
MTKTTNFTSMAMLGLQQFHETKKDSDVELLHVTNLIVEGMRVRALFCAVYVNRKRRRDHAGTCCLQDSLLYTVDLNKSWNE